MLAGSSMNRNVRVRDPDVAEGQLRSMVEKCKEALRSRDPRHLGSLLTLANFLRVQWRYGDAAAAAEELIRCAVEPESEYCGGANWSLAPYGHENCPLEHLLEIARTHTDSIKQAFYPRRVSRLCPLFIAMPSLSYSLPLGIPLSLPQYSAQV